ncbi:MAG: NGG1p interacting factor NIF3 [Candidatus Omnitrophica bacterium]|nr:NGG1p interacting factor NIF3 [Candidatus Omnitrophota bacterium]MBD3269835.1 NGG1p interacting factor NIF3 [Candidatus Omnitrophota bacterium]
MKLKKFYHKVVERGIQGDIRSRKEIKEELNRSKKKYESLSEDKKAFFDPDNLFNPFSDTRIVLGSEESQVKSIMVGIDIDCQEILLADRLRERGKKIDLLVSHHPVGRAYAKFYDVMDLQIDVFSKQGISLGISQNLLNERKSQVGRRVSAVNHGRPVDCARLLGINLFCMHTPCDNLAYQYLKKELEKTEPSTLGRIMEILFAIPDYKHAAQNNNPPQIVIGSESSRCRNIHLEFTGGTEGPKEIYKELASKGIDTVVAMHLSEEHVKMCRKENINVIFASHIASDSLGVNLMLDFLEKEEKLEIYDVSGFRRFKHKALNLK